MKSQYIFIVIFLVATAILGFFLIWPKYQELIIIQANIEETEARIEGREEYLLELKSLDKRLEQYESELRIIDSALFSEPWPSHLFDYLSKLAFQEGLVINQINFDVGSLGETKFKESGTSFSLLGSYSGLKSFLSTIESSGKLFNVRKISFSSVGGEPFSVDLILLTKSY